MVKLDEWKEKGDELLNSMLPKSVAERLLAGEDALDMITVRANFVLSLLRVE